MFYETPLLFLPSDHEITFPQNLHKAVELGVHSMGNENLVIFGVPPTDVQTGYGYIIPSLSEVKDGIYRVDQFIEKPTKQKAEDLLRVECYWNSGIFLGQAECWKKMFRNLFA